MPSIDVELLFKGVLGPQPVYLRSVVLRDFLSQHENFVILLHLLGHGLIQCVSHRHLLGAAGCRIAPTPDN